MNSIRSEFQAHDLSNHQIDQITRVRAAFSTLLGEIESYIPPGRERDIVTTKLQEASMLAVRGIAVQPSTPPTITSSSSAA